MAKSLKKSLSGEEMEFFVLDSTGRMAPDASSLIAKIERRHPKLGVSREAGRSMLEISSFPSVKVLDTFYDLLEKLKSVLEIAIPAGYVLYPMGTYPGKFEPAITKGRRYEEQEVLFGAERARRAAEVCGFHYHYTLPKGMFDTEKQFVKDVRNSRMKQAMIDSYNLSIALDPALTTLMQSSPYVQGSYLAKDSRLLIYRGGRKLRYMHGKYALHQSLGGLPPYKQTLNDLVFTLKRRQRRWMQMMAKQGLDPASKVHGESPLDYTWNPVKINKLGTLELRGMDMNHPKYAIATATLLKFVFRKLYRDLYHVMPSDIGLDEPFRVEGNIIHIPPHTHVRNKLQKESAYKGFDSREVASYTKRFLRFAKQFTDKNYAPVIKPLSEMVEARMSVSDMLIKRIRKMGYGGVDVLPDTVAAECALKSCERLVREVTEVEAKLEKASHLEITGAE